MLIPAKGMNSYTIIRPIRRIPTSSRNSLTTGPLMKQSRSALRQVLLRRDLRAAISTSTVSPAVMGTNSSTVIQSRPCVKLVRFTNQRPASSITTRLIHPRHIGTIRSPAGIFVMISQLTRYRVRACCLFTPVVRERTYFETIGPR